VRKTLNDQPFEYRSHNGVVFKAERSDFVGGVKVLIPPGLSVAEAMEDAAEMGAWHWANIVPDLNAFTGPATFTIKYAEEEEGPSSEVLRTPLLEFFSVKALEPLATQILARRLHNVLMREQEYRASEAKPILINTVGDFVDNYTLANLRLVPRLALRSIDLIVRRLQAEGIELRAK